MKKTCLFITGALLALGSASAAPIIVDSFSDTQSVLASGAAPVSNNAGIAAGAIGGARNITSSLSAGNGTATSNVNNGGSGRYEFSLTSGENGSFQLIYDGDTNNSVNATGLGGFDLTSLGTNNGLLLNMSSDLIAPITITIYSSAGDFSTRTFNTPGGNIPQNLFLTFASFIPTGAGANFASVGAITVNIDATLIPNATGLDGSIDFIRADVNVPEPASLTLIGAGLSALALILRRRQNA